MIRDGSASFERGYIGCKRWLFIRRKRRLAPGDSLWWLQPDGKEGAGDSASGVYTPLRY
jgi:hypothetical protein